MFGTPRKKLPQRDDRGRFVKGNPKKKMPLKRKLGVRR